MKSPRTSLFGAALILAVGLAASHATPLDDLGFTSLRAAHPELTGAGQTVAQPEASSAGALNYQVNPAATGLSSSIFHYYDSAHPYGTAGASFSASQDSGHADLVADHLYDAAGGGAPGVQSVENFDANYFYNSIVAPLVTVGSTTHWQPVAIAAPIVNQSFIFDSSDTALIAQVSLFYDAYANNYGTLFVNGLNNGAGSLTNAPASMFNGIAVGQSDGTHSGQAQIVAPGGQTSFATPYVTAAAVVLRQAAAAGDFQALAGNAATDARVLKAGLLNGATKTVGWTHTSSAPLDATSGTGLLNVKNSFDMLAGGQHRRSVSNLSTMGDISTATTFTSPLTALNGWDLAALTANTSKDAVNHYFFDLSSEISLTLTATLTWNSLVNVGAATDRINNFDFVLVDTVTHAVVWSSQSTSQNVEHIYLADLPGSKYDLQVILRGGTGTPALTDTYAAVWSWKSGAVEPVPESDFVWLIGAAGVVFIAAKRLAQRNRDRRA